MKELIRRDHFIFGKSIRHIARERRVSRTTVRAALRDAGPTLYKRKKPPIRPVTGPFVKFVEQILKDDESSDDPLVIERGCQLLCGQMVLICGIREGGPPTRVGKNGLSGFGAHFCDLGVPYT